MMLPFGALQPLQCLQCQPEDGSQMRTQLCEAAFCFFAFAAPA